MRFLSFKQLSSEKGIPYSRSHLHRLILAGKFPAQVRLSDSTSPNSLVGWRETDIDAWIAERPTTLKLPAGVKPWKPKGTKQSKKSRELARA
jgi:predicted DNA-binding transcriptional regulator AlpA